jgi:hypothetical protein
VGSKNSRKRFFAYGRREEINATIQLLSLPAKRVDAGAKAEQLLIAGPSLKGNGHVEKVVLTKLTDRVFPEHIAWVKQAVPGYSQRHPRRLRLTVDLLVCVAIDNLEDVRKLDTVIAHCLNEFENYR